MEWVDDITVLILTFDEAPNIERTLDALSWAKNIIVLDSGSSDETSTIVRRYPSAKLITRKFDTFAEQCNFGLSQISTTWVLSIDADYVLSDELSKEICCMVPTPEVAGFTAGFIYCVYGSPLRATIYPARCVLYLRERASYRNLGHGHRVIVDGVIHNLAGRIRHDDRKPLRRWFHSQQEYARKEADFLLTASTDDLDYVDRIRRMAWLAPPLVFFHTLIWARCILEGWRGWFYVLQRTISEMMIALEIVDRRLRQRSDIQTGRQERQPAKRFSTE